MSRSLFVIGAGGHATVLVEILKQLNRNIAGLVVKEHPHEKLIFSGISHYSDDDILKFDKSKILLVNGIGSLPGNDARVLVQKKFKALGYEFMTVVSPKAVVSEYATLHEGVQVMPGAIINASAVICEGTIINTGAIIDHDCTIGAYNHVAPGAVLSGGVVTGSLVHVGTGATIIQSIKVGNNALVGAGSTVTRNLVEGAKHYAAKSHVV